MIAKLRNRNAPAAVSPSTGGILVASSVSFRFEFTTGISKGEEAAIDAAAEEEKVMTMLKTMASATLILGLVALSGCAGLGGASPEELVMQQLQSVKDDLLAGNVDNILDYISEDFDHYEVGGKEELADYVEMGRDMGYMDDVKALIEEHEGELFIDDAEVTLEGDTASVYPIDASAVEGSVTVELIYQKDPDGVWRIVGADVEGV